MLGRLLTSLLTMQTAWAEPVGAQLQRALAAVYLRLGPVKSLLHGTWLGHSLHATLVAVPIGALTVSLLLDLVGEPSAADLTLTFGVIALIVAAIAGGADYVETDGRARTVATVHVVVMSAALICYLVSLGLRLGQPDERALPIIASGIGLVVLALGGFIGGEIVYGLGGMVSRHAWRFWGAPTWQVLDIGELLEGIPTRGRAGGQSLVLVRDGDQIHALHDVCAHAGGPLSEGRLVDGCIECPFHQSRFELATGHRTQGPTTFDQPRYDIRRRQDGRWEVRRAA